MAKLAGLEVEVVAIRKCGTCRVRYAVRLVPATDHIRTTTGANVFRTEWEVIA